VAQNITLDNLTDARGHLTVVDRKLPFAVRRAYFVTDVPPGVIRGGHRHRRNRQLLICLRGSCEVAVHDGTRAETVVLNAPDHGLLLEPADWHQMRLFSPDALLLVLASEAYDVTDYIDEPYE